ncbi:SgcJ/EcaC family oxidoreductase [Pararhodobacter sp. CCB-MM2]|uniref:YybH family protein n=1 Tax=Pararhodobacter sp. CCB-MM2 TaxID=1786003 RepID=UPI0008324127|nr:nuclear transport factor 2 family protein [Pararhodobacter sp. CCB-MM2]MCA2011668.1 nuclear transport factor 2 family protein [Cereibacter sphaeroides]
MRVSRPFLFLIITLLIALGAGISTASAQVADPREAPALMVQAVAAQDANAVAALYASDAVVLSPNGATSQGREAIMQAWTRNFAGGYAALEILQSRTERGSDRAATLMVWQATVRQNGQEQTIRGRSLIYYVQGEDGWLISADMSQIAG